MAIIKEPLFIDFVVENRQLKLEEQKLISDYIASQKKEIALSKNQNKRDIKTVQKI